MRIGNIIDTTKTDVSVVTNYSKADFTQRIKTDITDIGRDAEYLVDQGGSLQDVMEAAGALDVQTTQDYMTVMSNTMSEEDYQAMMKDGFNPREMTGKESVTILDHIKAVMAESGEVITGFNDNLDIDKLIEITGSEANAHSLAEAVKTADIPTDDTELTEINKAAQLITQITPPDESVIREMISRGMAPTIDNIYKASFSGASSSAVNRGGYYSLEMSGYLGKKSETDTGKDMTGEIEALLNRYGIDDIEYDDQLHAAKWLISNDLNVTDKNIHLYQQISSLEWPISYDAAVRIASNSVSNGKAAKNADLNLDKENVYVKAARTLEIVNRSNEAAVDSIVADNRILNIKNLEQAANNVNIVEAIDGKEAEKKAGYLALEETRLRMTLDINVSLLKKGIEIDTMSLSKLVEKLKEEQTQLSKNVINSAENSDSRMQLYTTTCKAVKELPYMPAAVIGRLKLEEEYSLSKVHEAGTELKTKYEEAGQKYETLMTAPRADLGDSLSKAWQNIDEILESNNIHADETGRKAVRILVYNNMEISEANVARIEEALGEVNNVINKLTPEKVLRLIRDNINPMDMNMKELSDTLKSMSVEESDEQYAKFLYKAEKAGNISEEERKSYIGIYRFINRLEKTDGAAIGAMVNQGRDITFRSLLSGIRSKRADVNVQIDDSFGLLDNVIGKGINISDQIESAFDNHIGFEQSKAAEDEYLKQTYREYKQSLELFEQEEYMYSDTVSEAVALQALTDDSTNIYRKMYKAAQAGYSIEDPENISEAFDNIIDNLEDRDTAVNSFESMKKTVMEYIERYRTDCDSYIDLKGLMLCGKQLSVATSLNRHEDYIIPIITDDGYTSVRLSFVHEKNQNDDIDIYCRDSKGYEINTHLHLEDDILSGLIVCEDDSVCDRMKAVCEGLVSATGFENTINIVKGKENKLSKSNYLSNNTDINNVDTKSLYRVAKAFLTEFAKA